MSHSDHQQHDKDKRKRKKRREHEHRRSDKAHDVDRLSSASHAPSAPPLETGTFGAKQFSQHDEHLDSKPTGLTMQQHRIRVRPSATNDNPSLAPTRPSVITARASALDASTISKMFDRRDQLPLGPHANRVLVHRLVDDRERHKGGQSKTLQTDADLGGTLSDEADVHCGGDDFLDAARTLYGVVLKRQTGDRRKCVSLKLESARPSQKQDQRAQVSHKEERELRQLAQLGRQPFELVFPDLEHTLEVRSMIHSI
jgi:hypothetical protein